MERLDKEKARAEQTVDGVTGGIKALGKLTKAMKSDNEKSSEEEHKRKKRPNHRKKPSGSMDE